MALLQLSIVIEFLAENLYKFLRQINLIYQEHLLIYMVLHILDIPDLNLLCEKTKLQIRIFYQVKTKQKPLIKNYL